MPLLEPVVVGERRAVEGRLEVRLRVGAAEEVLARTDLADGVERLAVLGQIHSREQRMHHARLIGVHHELLVAHGQTALEPPGGMQHEVDTRETGGSQRVGRLVGRLGIRDLGRAQCAARAERNAETPRERCHDVQHQRRLGRSESRRARLHRDRGREAAGYHRAVGVYWSPKRIFVISMVSSARLGCVTEPMYGLSLYFMCAYTMSKCRLLTGRSTGSQTVPPE